MARGTRREWGTLSLEVAGGYVAAWVVGVGFGLAMANIGVWHVGLPWERAVLTRIHDWTVPGWVDRLLLWAPYTGTNLTMLPVMFAVSLWLWRWRKRTDVAVQLLVVSIGSLSLNPAMKYLLGRERPELFPRRGLFQWASYPSGHTTLTIALYFTIALLLRRERGWRWPFAAAAFIVFGNAYSRLYLAVHWPSDLIGGALIGTVWLLVTWTAFERFRLRVEPANA